MVDSINKKAQTKLLNAFQFYHECQEIKQKNKIERLYFGDPNILLSYPYSDLKLEQWYLFFDDLASYLLNFSQLGQQTTFLFLSNNNCSPQRTEIKIVVKIIGEGMIGRVAHVLINEEVNFAFKVFFDPEFVWHHGQWAEIPLGIYLKAHQVTKDFAQFQFASEKWAIWEWISPQAKPENRPGIYYHDFAKKNNLNTLNYLNHDNYNPHLIRLDPGGIQREYLGRRLHNLIMSIIFYYRKIQQKGPKFLLLYIMRYNLKEYIILCLSLFIAQRKYQKLKSN